MVTTAMHPTGKLDLLVNVGFVQLAAIEGAHGLFLMVNKYMAKSGNVTDRGASAQHPHLLHGF
jgi:hypothetical protein